ncbi:MAG: hypothetical protein JWQ28_431 [Pedobacter sp.]|jgi:uncharacterized protein YecE (DUF72 family)|nr:hypothetical protein [Pedobacter sp.]
MEWRIGCSGFLYREWKEIFYPKGLAAKNWFQYYCEHYNTIEINSSFYKLPTIAALKAWYDKSPQDFLFTIKAPRGITHFKKFNDIQPVVNDFYSLIEEGLGDKLGCILFQLPPSYSYTEERLYNILNHLNPNYQNVLEFRHASWWNEHAIRELSLQNITFSGISYPSALPDDLIQNTEVVYYRFHGRPVLYKSLYEQTEIEDFVKQFDEPAKRVFVYFNNTWGTSALTNSKQLMELVNSENTQGIKLL